MAGCGEGLAGWVGGVQVTVVTDTAGPRAGSAVDAKPSGHCKPWCGRWPLRDYITHWNTAAKPFTWTATSDEILAKVRLVQVSIKKFVDNNAKTSESRNTRAEVDMPETRRADY
jgi:hypothetical protein